MGSPSAKKGRDEVEIDTYLGILEHGYEERIDEFRRRCQIYHFLVFKLNRFLRLFRIFGFRSHFLELAMASSLIFVSNALIFNQ
jgi:hypothetical protein